VLLIKKGEEVHVEKYRFDRKLQEAALRKSDQQPIVIIDGKERRASTG